MTAARKTSPTPDELRCQISCRCKGNVGSKDVYTMLSLHVNGLHRGKTLRAYPYIMVLNRTANALGDRTRVRTTPIRVTRCGEATGAGWFWISVDGSSFTLTSLVVAGLDSESSGEHSGTASLSEGPVSCSTGFFESISSI